MESAVTDTGPAVCQVTLAGGCFWNIEAGFRGVFGILATVVGYTGGDEEHPDYTSVSTGETGHAEAVRVAYDPAIISLAAILSRFFGLHDPASEESQAGFDGSQYRSVIFCHTEEDCWTARAFIREEEASGKYTGPVVTAVLPAVTFWPAEDCHQQYYEKLGNRYRHPLF
ncbi:peptide-methionine (S)-S-oxide reductase MsrA [Methanogenium sp. MK-MG]|uniref:peptide-methionine (S)-S-oxide reductase MsrA n=1 Tax=Methanogenium sp. MK-MG TaxID=2599926 RepID=UPI0013EBFD6B|nr:peptide-methionine (S)-S-oxide reductase MsrA [Methanogenium sp. MK-MG]KAF1078089.1 Peptide methionine sulfoxide reductase MsrA [Methanogenium sp. MK-MG]